MTPGLAAMLAGAFGVPILLLWGGHRLRRATTLRRRMFWGALIGHVLSVPVAMLAAMRPPAEWSAADVLRGAMGYWLLLLAPLVGAIVAAATRGRARD